MTLIQESPQPLAPMRVASSRRMAKFKMHIAEGDILVLLTREEFPQFVCAFSVEKLKHAPDLFLCIRHQDGQIFEAKERTLDIHQAVSIRIPVPIKIVRTSRGYRTIAEVEIDYNFQLYDRSFIRQNMPEVYRRINL